MSDQIAEYEVRMRAAMEVEGEREHPTETAAELLKPVEAPSAREPEDEEVIDPVTGDSAVADANKIRKTFLAENAVDVQKN